MYAIFAYKIWFIQQATNLVHKLSALVSEYPLWCPKPVKEIDDAARDNCSRFIGNRIGLGPFCVVVNQDTNVLVAFVGPGDFTH